MSLGLAAVLVGIALVGGVCITTIGPGGIFVTIALFHLLDLSPGGVAGTASVTFVATGLLGSMAYLRSGELRGRAVTRAAMVLSGASVVGAFSGAWLNTRLDASTFGALLGAFVAGTGALILWREWRARQRARGRADGRLGIIPGAVAASTSVGPGTLGMALVGVGVGLPAGLLGVGGPVLAVPVLVMLGTPMLVAVGLAQVQSIFISAFAALGYGMQGVIDWGVALLVGIPLVVGTAAGWWLAHRIPVARLKLGLALVLVGIGLYLLAG
ncbi:MAG: sulfite exporter TauE/SafE family protein [Gemmatimonadales bacterium]|nr:MAG: sulfite exporter TauE/SafE family protein [Gemmatimonadales bacterium]